MKTIDLKKVVLEKNPSFKNKPKIYQKVLLSVLHKILHIDDLNDLFVRNDTVYGINFIDSLFDQLNFSYRITSIDYKKIPAEGRLIIVANHPIGSLDGLGLLKAVAEVRHDVKIVANEVLLNVQNLTSHFLPYKLDSRQAQKDNIIAIGNALENEEAIIIFPAGEVSRLRFHKIMDGPWTKGAVFFAKKYNSPVLPIFVEARNSPLFYFVSAIYKPLSTLFLSREVWNKNDKVINFHIGDPIPAKVFTSSHVNYKELSQLLKKHTYSLNSKLRKKIFITEKNIIHPVDRQLLKRELAASDFLGKTSDNKSIIITDMDNSPNVIEEVARLREVTFRKVGEGTGKAKDLDGFDKYYKHIIVWDEDDLEIVGAYRIGVGRQIMPEFGHKGFYSSTLFEFSNDFIQNYLDNAIEMGRSFVQKKYWNTNALHYLWQGIGAYLARNPETKYMFGPVSLSNNYPEKAKEMIVYYYMKWYGGDVNLAPSYNPYILKESLKEELDEIFDGDLAQKEYKTLKFQLKPYNYSVPVLYKHYSDLCDGDGVRFLGFGIDESFEKCVDGFIIVDISKIKEEKIKRYVEPYLPKDSK